MGNSCKVETVGYSTSLKDIQISYFIVCDYLPHTPIRFKWGHIMIIYDKSVSLYNDVKMNSKISIQSQLSVTIILQSPTIIKIWSLIYSWNEAKTYKFNPIIWTFLSPCTLILHSEGLKTVLQIYQGSGFVCGNPYTSEDISHILISCTAYG